MIPSWMTTLFWIHALLAAGVIAVDPDRDEGCESWAKQGECDNNPDYMIAHCATSCNNYHVAAMKLNEELAPIKSFYDLSARDITGTLVPFATLRGKVTIIVNVASYCGYTESHYRGLVELWSRVKDEKVEILAFPCNQFGQQEPESHEQIMQFANNKGVEFRMMEKINVNGPDASLVYKYLKREAGPANIGWNFATYFVVSPDGAITSHSGVEPMDLLDFSMGLIDKEL